MASQESLLAVLDGMETPVVAALLLASRPGVTRHHVAAITGESPAEVARRLRAGLLLVRARLDEAERARHAAEGHAPAAV